MYRENVLHLMLVATLYEELQKQETSKVRPPKPLSSVLGQGTALYLFAVCVI